MNHCQCGACIDGILHASDCAVHNAPARKIGRCSCGAICDFINEAMESTVKPYAAYNVREALDRIQKAADMTAGVAVGKWYLYGEIEAIRKELE